PADLAAAVRQARGPFHANVQLDDPLTPTDRWTPTRPSDTADPALAHRRVGPPAGAEPVIAESIGTDRRTVVVAGDDAGPPARQLAEAGGWPLLAEPSSGSRTGDNAIRTYRLLLGTELAERIERVVVFGHPTLSRPVARLLARTDVEVIAAPARGVWAVPAHRVDRRLLTTRPIVGARDESATPEGQVGWLGEWKDADRSVGRQLDRLLAEEPELTPLEVAGAVARALPGGGQLVVGPSNPIRDLDLMVPRYDVGARRKVIANRGLAGIDGVVSTAIGAALGRHDGSTRDLALMGDVTFLHDANGLILGPDEPRPDLTIVVVNDDGGSIFATLEQGAEQYADAFERLFATPHHVDIAALCAATRTPHLKVTSTAELEQALANPNGGIEVIEAVVGRADRRGLDQRIRALRP
ncbi:MAG: thiamine pyrophosphate-dependent enzyme, partial [Nocardioides sp.]